MKVVLDTNAIYSDYNFKKPSSRILISEIKKGNLELFIPEVVLEEIVNKFRQRMEKGQKDVASELQTLADLAMKNFSSPLPADFATESAAAYRARLLALFDEHKITVLEIPQTDHRFLVQKAMHKKKPFNASEKGYRDSLIWENIKSLITSADEDVASTPELVFITDKHDDFLNGDQLHEDLIAELEAHELQTTSIVVYRNLKDFTDGFLKLYEVQADNFKDRLNRNEFWDFELKTIITGFLDKEYVGHSLGEFEFTAPGDYSEDEREVVGYEDDFEIEKLSVKKISSDEFVVELEIGLNTELEMFMDKSNHYRYGNYTVIEPDWNRHVMLVNQTDTVKFTVTLIINSKLECLSIEMNKIEEY